MQTLLTPQMVIDPPLLDALRRAAGLEELRAGRHILRNPQRDKTGECTVRKLWIVEVQPPITPAGCLARIEFDQHVSVFFIVPNNSGNRLDSLSSLSRQDIECPDPVGQALSTMDVWTHGNEIPFGGCSYGLCAATAQGSTAMRFGNPSQPSFMAVEDALLAVARPFITADTAQSITDFLARWESGVNRGMG